MLSQVFFPEPQTRQLLRPYVDEGLNSECQQVSAERSTFQHPSTSVLRNVAGDARNEVFSVLASDIVLATAVRQAMNLPQDLLASRMRSQAPVLDLREAELSPIQWARLSACILQTEPNAIATLHVAADAADASMLASQPEMRLLCTKVQGMQQHCRAIDTSNQQTRCSTCSARSLPHSPSHVLIGFPCPVSRNFCAAAGVPPLSLSACKADV